MSYKIRDIPGMVKVLKKAAELIKNEEQSFICLALDQIYREEDSLTNSGRKAKALIIEMLEGHYTLNSWLSDKTGKTQYELYYSMRQYRLQWIDQIIRDLEFYQYE